MKFLLYCKNKHGGVVKSTLLHSGYQDCSAIWEAAIGKEMAHEREHKHTGDGYAITNRRNQVSIGPFAFLYTLVLSLFVHHQHRFIHIQLATSKLHVHVLHCTSLTLRTGSILPKIYIMRIFLRKTFLTYSIDYFLAFLHVL